MSKRPTRAPICCSVFGYGCRDLIEENLDYVGTGMRGTASVRLVGFEDCRPDAWAAVGRTCLAQCPQCRTRKRRKLYGAFYGEGADWDNAGWRDP